MLNEEKINETKRTRRMGGRSASAKLNSMLLLDAKLTAC